MIRLTIRPTPIQRYRVVAATDKERAVLAFYLLALAVKVGKLTPKASLQLAKSLYANAGNAKQLKPLLTLLSAGKKPDTISIDAQSMAPDAAKLARLIMRTNTKEDASYAQVARLAPLVADTKLTALWTPEAVKPKPTGTKKDQQAALRQYLKDLLIVLVRQKTPFPTILSKLDKELGKPLYSKAVPKPLIPDLNVTESGALLYKGEPLVSRALSPVTIWVLRGATSKLIERSRGEDSYIFAYSPAAATGTSLQKAYKLSSVQKQNKKKWSNVNKLLKNLPKVKAAWYKLLVAGEALGAVLHFAYLTSARIGTLGNSTDGKTTFGVTTLLGKHLKWKGKSAVITYKGKSGQLQTHVLEPNKETLRLLAYLQKRSKTIAPTDVLFADDEEAVTSTGVNAWLKKLIPGITIKNFRTLRGTSLAIEVLEALGPKIPKGVSQSEANKLFKEALTQVGKILGHYTKKGDTSVVTPATSIKHYVEPSVSIQWFKDLKLEVPNFVPAAQK